MSDQRNDSCNDSHLPECPMLDERYPKHPLEKCDYCEMLRACEQRVRMENDDYAYVAVQAEADGRRRGWNKALYAAQEAIRNREDGEHFQWVQVEIALAAIDALRSEA